MRNFTLRELSGDEITRVVDDMDQGGYARIADFFPAEIIDDARSFVTHELERHAREYFSYIGREPVRNSILAEIGASNAFRNLLVRVYETGTHATAPESGVYQVLRVLSGRTGLNEAYQFHYDAYVVTALMPIAIPSGEGEKRGDLIMYPKLRRVRSTVVVNLVEKLLLQNAVARRIARSAIAQRLLGAKVLRMKPGDLYLFWGYQSLHGNEPCFPTSTRATALFHFADPHEASSLVASIQRWRSRHERKVRERALASTRAHA